MCFEKVRSGMQNKEGEMERGSGSLYALVARTCKCDDYLIISTFNTKANGRGKG